MIFEEKRVNSKKIYDGRILSLRVDTVTAPAGHAYREIVEHNGAVAAVALHTALSSYGIAIMYLQLLLVTKKQSS